MEPFYTTPQSFVPLSVQMQDSMDLGEPDLFNGVDLIDLLGRSGAYGGGRADSEEMIAKTQTEYADPVDAEPELSWQQRISNRVAGNRFPGASQEDRDMAFRRGAGALGEVLLAAALAPDARSRAAVLARALPSAAGAYRQELGSIVKARDEQGDREYQRTQRAREGERYEHEKGQRARNVTEQGREDAERGALEGQGGEWRAQFERYISDKDINDNERGALSTAFNTALSRFEANPSPANADKVLAALSGTAKAANEYEDLVTEATNELTKEALKTNRTPEEVAKAMGESDLRKSILEKLQISNAQRSATRGARDDEKAERYGALEQQVFDAFLRGEPMSTPAGHLLIPDTPGVSVANPPRTQQTRMSELDKLVLKNPDIQALAGSATMAESISPETAGILQRWMPDLQFSEGNDGSIVLPANERIKFLQQWTAAGSGQGAATSAAPPQAGPKPKVMSRADVEAAAKADGVSMEEAVKRLEAIFKRPVVVQ